WARDGSEGGFIGMPDTLTTLLYVCQEGGLRRYDLHREQIPEVPLDPRTGQQDMDELVRYMRVATELERLQTAGILEGDEVRVRGSAPVLIAATGFTEILGPMGEAPESTPPDPAPHAEAGQRSVQHHCCRDLPPRTQAPCPSPPY